MRSKARTETRNRTMSTPRRAAASAGRAALLLISALMIWEAFSPRTFVSFVMGPARVYLQLSYIAPIVGSVVSCGHAISDLVSKRRPIGTGFLWLLLTLAWCFSVAASLVVMAVRSIGI